MQFRAPVGQRAFLQLPGVLAMTAPPNNARRFLCPILSANHCAAPRTRWILDSWILGSAGQARDPILPSESSQEIPANIAAAAARPCHATHSLTDFHATSKKTSRILPCPLVACNRASPPCSLPIPFAPFPPPRLLSAICCPWIRCFSCHRILPISSLQSICA